VFLPIGVCANKLIPYSELIIFIGYEDNGYCFIHHIQGNIIFHSTPAIFDEGLFPKCTNSHTKEYKLYNKLLDKISLETELLAPDFSKKDRPALVSIPYSPIPSIQNNPYTCSPSSSLSYKSTSLLSTLRPKKPIIEVKEINDIDFDVKMLPPSPQ